MKGVPLQHSSLLFYVSIITGLVACLQSYVEHSDFELSSSILYRCHVHCAIPVACAIHDLVTLELKEREIQGAPEWYEGNVFDVVETASLPVIVASFIRSTCNHADPCVLYGTSSARHPRAFLFSGYSLLLGVDLIIEGSQPLCSGSQDNSWRVSCSTVFNLWCCSLGISTILDSGTMMCVCRDRGHSRRVVYNISF